MDILQPAWTDLEALVASATDELTIVTPFYTDDGVTRIFDYLRDQTSLSVVTRLSPPDWASGVADPDSLYALLDLTRGRHQLSILRNLHAKVYVADRHTALLGSSNLTWGGFGRNVELGVRVTGTEAGTVLDTTITACAGGRSLDVDSLRAWMDRSRPLIQIARGQAAAVSDDLAEPQAELDRILGFGQATTPLPDPDQQLLAAFVDWLRRHPDLAGSRMIVHRYDNPDGSNLQGHVKQCFAAAYRFCAGAPATQAELRRELAALNPGDIYQPSGAVADAWNRHLDDHALDSGATWSYSILRGLLPVSLGGTVANGGGGSSTLKRMLPLVAEYRAETGAPAMPA